MKTTALAVRIAALSMLLVLMSCGMPVGEQGTASKDSSSLLLRPRSTSDQFDFETISEVRFEVAVEWVDSGEAPTAKAIVELSRPDGSELYTGATEVGLTHRFAVSIPLTDSDYRLNVVVPGIARERFDLPNLARSSAVRATARLRNNVVSIQSESDVKDSDGDGIVDTYDAFPDKSESAFQDQIPADGRFTVAFEDNFPNVGDADYNDFVAQYVIRVIRNPENEVLVLDGDIWARARAAGYDHEFGLVVQFPGLQGFLNANYSQADGATDFVRTHTTEAVSEEARITIFPSTKGAFVRSSGHVRPDNGYPNGPWSEGYVGSFRISGISSIDPGVPFDDWSLSVDHFDPYLLVHNTDRKSVV